MLSLLNIQSLLGSELFVKKNNLCDIRSCVLRGRAIAATNEVLRARNILQDLDRSRCGANTAPIESYRGIQIRRAAILNRTPLLEDCARRIIRSDDIGSGAAIVREPPKTLCSALVIDQIVRGSASTQIQNRLP